MKDTHVESFSPMRHWTGHNIRGHVFTCVLALQIAHLMRRTAARAGLRIPVRELLAQLAGIGETVLIYPSTRIGGRPEARRMATELTGDQARLHEIFGLDRWAPRSQVTGTQPPGTYRHLRKHEQDQLTQETRARSSLATSTGVRSSAGNLTRGGSWPGRTARRHLGST